MKVLQIFLLVIGLVVLVKAQAVATNVEKSILTGRVCDEFGVAIPDAKIMFTDKSGRVTETVTNQIGAFQAELDGGKYRIEVKRLGFEAYKVENYKVANKSRMQIDFSLDVKAAVDYVTLSSEEQRAVTSVLSGTVYDAMGSVVARAKVTAVDTNGRKFETVTNEEGVFKLTLPFNKYDTNNYYKFGEARYDLVVESRGFKRSEIKGYVFIPSQFGKMQLDIGLALGRTSD